MSDDTFIAVEETANGREIRQDTRTGKFSVQPRNDNYWIVVDTLEQARDAFEHTPRQLRISLPSRLVSSRRGVAELMFLEPRMTLAEQLRALILAEPSIYALAKEVGISQPTLQEFARGKADGTLADMKLTAAQKLIDHYGLRVSVPKSRAANT